MSDPRNRSLLVDAARLTGRITYEFRRSPYASLLDTSDPDNPVIILNPDEPDDVLTAEVCFQAEQLLARHRARRTSPDLELVFDAEDEELPQAVNGDDEQWATRLGVQESELVARARRRGFGLIDGGAG